VTPLFLAIVTIELADIAFAVDSVPAALAVTDNAFLVYSSNVFAILGLRALYAVLAVAVSHLRYIHWGVAAVLALAAVKMVVSKWVHIPPLLAVGLIVLCIGVSVAASLLHRRTASHRALEEAHAK
jgi:tellurite resistance protein TerC